MALNIASKRIIFLLAMSLMAKVGGDLYSQTYPPRFQLGLNFMLAFPQDEFNDYVDHPGFGGAGEFLYTIPVVPVSIGAAFGYLIYGEESRSERFSTTIPDVSVKVTTTNNIFTGHFLLRALPRHGRVRPYMDGLIGFNYLFTQTKIESKNSGEEVASSTNLDDFAFSYGGGGGLMITVYEKPFDEGPLENELGRVNIDFRIRYLFGSEAKYLKEGSIQIVGGDVYTDENKSVTDVITFQLGVTLEF